MESKVEVITPYVAEKFLAQSDPNRPVRPSRVAFYADAIKRGEWKMNGSTIVFDENGQMLDGQHRCLAVIKAGRSIRSLVARGAEAGSFATIDSGIKRTAGDALAMSGEVGYNNLAAMLRFIHNVEENGGLQESAVSTPQVQAALVKHPTAREWVRRFNLLRHRKLGGALPACAVLCLIEEIAGDAVLPFFDSLMTGDNLPASSPILILRNRMMTDPVLKAGSSTSRRAVGDLVIRAWNAHVRGERLSRLVPNKNDHIGNILIPA